MKNGMDRTKAAAYEKLREANPEKPAELAQRLQASSKLYRRWRKAYLKKSTTEVEKRIREKTEKAFLLEKITPEKVEEWKKANPAKVAEFINKLKFKKRPGRITTHSINTRFEGSSAHHMEKYIVIYLPDTLHKSVRHDLEKGTNMLKINDLAMAWFEGLIEEVEVSNGLDGQHLHLKKHISF